MKSDIGIERVVIAAISGLHTLDGVANRRLLFPPGRFHYFSNRAQSISRFVSSVK